MSLAQKQSTPDTRANIPKMSHQKAQLESLSNLASDKELEGKGTTVKLEGRNATTEPKTGQESKDSTDNIGDWL